MWEEIIHTFPISTAPLKLGKCLYLSVYSWCDYLPTVTQTLLDKGAPELQTYVQFSPIEYEVVKA